MIGARRLIIRRGLGLAAGLLTGGAQGAVDRMARPQLNDMLRDYGGGHPGEPMSAGDTAESNARNAAAQALYKARQKRIVRASTRHRAWNMQDDDLTVLASTSRSWRASVMFDRLRDEATWQERLERRLTAIWNDPIASVKANTVAWLKDMLK